MAGISAAEHRCCTLEVLHRACVFLTILPPVHIGGDHSQLRLTLAGGLEKVALKASLLTEVNSEQG